MADTALSILNIKETDFATEVEQSPLPVFVDFWAPWCAPCVALTPVFEALAKDYGGQIKFVKANLDDNKAVAERLAVRQLPTLLLIKDGQIVERVLGGRHKAYFSSLLDKHARRPVAAAEKPASASRAFLGDAGLRDQVAERVHAHIEAGRIIPSESTDQIRAFFGAGPQRYNLMEAAAETFDDRSFEEALGIPAAVGHLQATLHGLLVRAEGEGADTRFRLDPLRNAWPVDWWRAIPPGANLQSLPAHLLQWLLQDLVDDANPYRPDLPDAVRSALLSLSRLHGRTARGEVPTTDEWQAARTALGGLLKPLRDDNPDDYALEMFERNVEQLAWPADELGEALSDAIFASLHMAGGSMRPDGYTSEQWAEHKRLSTELRVRAREARRARLSSLPDDMTPEQRESVREELDALEEVKAEKAYAERFRPVAEAHRAEALSILLERLHAGLMQALSATVSSTP